MPWLGTPNWPMLFFLFFWAFIHVWMDLKTSMTSFLPALFLHDSQARELNVLQLTRFLLCQATKLYSPGYGSIPIDTFLVGWTSIYQLFWGSLGTRVLTHPQIVVEQTDSIWLHLTASGSHQGHCKSSKNLALETGTKLRKTGWRVGLATRITRDMPGKKQEELPVIIDMTGGAGGFVHRPY